MTLDYRIHTQNNYLSYNVGLVIPTKIGKCDQSQIDEKEPNNPHVILEVSSSHPYILLGTSYSLYIFTILILHKI